VLFRSGGSFVPVETALSNPSGKLMLLFQETVPGEVDA